MSWRWCLRFWWNRCERLFAILLLHEMTFGLGASLWQCRSYLTLSSLDHFFVTFVKIVFLLKMFLNFVGICVTRRHTKKYISLCCCPLSNLEFCPSTVFHHDRKVEVHCPGNAIALLMFTASQNWKKLSSSAESNSRMSLLVQARVYGWYSCTATKALFNHK